MMKLATGHSGHASYPSDHATKKRRTMMVKFGAGRDSVGHRRYYRLPSQGVSVASTARRDARYAGAKMKIAAANGELWRHRFRAKPRVR